MLDQARSVISTTLAIAAALFVLWVIGITTARGTHGMGAVGAGISAVFRAAAELVGSIHF